MLSSCPAGHPEVSVAKGSSTEGCRSVQTDAPMASDVHSLFSGEPRTHKSLTAHLTPQWGLTASTAASPAMEKSIPSLGNARTTREV